MRLKERDMHWFKILLMVMFGLNVLIHLINSRKGKYTQEREAWTAPLAAVINLLLLWGVFYL